jgi:hypothetical protein
MPRRTTIGVNPLDAVTPAPGAVRGRRPAGRPAEEVQAATGAALASVETAADASYSVLDAWLDGLEATVRATLDAQNGVLTAGLSLVDATASGGRATLEHWTEATRQAQEAALAAFRANARAAGLFVWCGGLPFAGWRGR